MSGWWTKGGLWFCCSGYSGIERDVLIQLSEYIGAT